jgi:hypothetical protein
MKNHWLNRFRVGKRVRYKGVDKALGGKMGYIIRVLTGYQSEWVDVQFELTEPFTRTQIVSVEKDNLELI